MPALVPVERHLVQTGKAHSGSRLTFQFRGSMARLYDLLGPDGGQVMITVDGQAKYALWDLVEELRAEAGRDRAERLRHLIDRLKVERGSALGALRGRIDTTRYANVMTRWGRLGRDPGAKTTSDQPPSAPM